MKKKKKNKKKENVKELKSEFKKTTSTAIIAAFGLLVALAWKDVITGFVDKITKVSPVQSKLISALFITIIAVLGIWITSKAFREKEN